MVLPSTSPLGKPPTLPDLSPQSITNFLLGFELYFDLKDITSPRKKILMVGLSVTGFVELNAWWTGSMEQHLAKTYDSFIKDLKREALPRDYVWETEREIRESRQRGQDYGDWASILRLAQQAISSAAMSDAELVKNLLYGMDVELARFLRQHDVLAGSGFHEDDRNAIGLGAALPSLAPPVPADLSTRVATKAVDYLKFDRVARDQWAVIAARRADVAKQLASKKSSIPSTSTRSTPSSGAPAPAKPARLTPTSSAAPASTGSAALTLLERAYLTATYGCTKCRRSWQDHRATSCPHEIARHRVQVPASFKAGDSVTPPISFVPSPNSYAPKLPSAVSTPDSAVNSATTGLRGLSLVEDVEEDEDKTLDWSSEEDEYTELHLPSLTLRAGFPSLSLTGEALADSGCSSIYISDRMVERLGLVKQRLKKVRTAKLAIKGGLEQSLEIAHYVRLPLSLPGVLDFGLTLLKVAPLESPYDFILGNPFLQRHRLSLHLHPHPRIVRSAALGEEEIDLLERATHGPAVLPDALPSINQGRPDRLVHASILARIAVLEMQERKTKEREEEQAKMDELRVRLMADFADRFPDGIPPLSQADKSEVRHHIRLVDEGKTHNQRGYPSPARWNAKWKHLLDKHVDAGRLRLSRSPFASPSFVQPKKDPLADPRWLNDYRRLNANTIKDRTPLPLPDEILSQAATGKFWAKIDMSDAFFQTLVYEPDIPKTAIKTPWGLYEWVVMPQGLCNAPATHQRRMNEALSSQIGRICHAFVDDIVIWAATLEEHERNVREVLTALRSAGLYCSPKKTDLVTIDTEFLGHRISRSGIGADPNKVNRVVNWPTPTTVKQLRGFLGLVQYLRKFIPGLAQQTALLTPLTRKGLGDITALWGEKEEKAFQEIRRVVTSLPVLRPVDHSDGADPIWLMTDASKVGLGAVLLQGKDWKTAYPCGYYSRQYIAAERNYPTHEQELLAVVAALKAYRIDLLGERFVVLTDHDTLRHFPTQPDLSKRQARWLEVLADYDYDTVYVPGKKNVMADGLSRYPFQDEKAEPGLIVMGLTEATLSKGVLNAIRNGYLKDPEAEKMRAVARTSSLFREEQGLLYTDDGRLMVPGLSALRETLLHDAHDAVGHFGALKTYESLTRSFYWPSMSRDVRKYCRSCDVCQRMKAATQKQQGAPHPLPVPPRPFSDVALDFVGPLPKSSGHDYLLTISDRLTGYHWVRLFGQPERLVSDRDRLFTSRFWKALQRCMGTKLQMSTAFHPETDGRSERTNKTTVQYQRCGERLHRDRRQRFKSDKNKDKRSAKLFPRYDGPYPVVAAFPSQSLYQLRLNDDDTTFPTFHISKLRRYVPNDPFDFPSRQPARPEPVDVQGVEEYKIEKIADERTRRGKREFMVKWE
ncbi:hypothetical protein JCM8547_003592, partial [Rhodosporidiobolus lusitaniae]